MTDTQLPIIRQMHDAEDDRARAGILLSVPDLLLAKFATVFDDACRRAAFDAGRDFIVVRLTAMRAVRDETGNLPTPVAAQLEEYRTTLAAFAASRHKGGGP